MATTLASVVVMVRGIAASRRHGGDPAMGVSRGDLGPTGVYVIIE